MDTTAMERTEVRDSHPIVRQSEQWGSMNEVHARGSSSFLAIEKKWSKRWAEEKVFEVEPNGKKEKKYITAAFPYPNSPQHIGHGRTYTTTDIYVRYLRLKGYNVLFPMAFHVTGTPILAMAKRIADKDEEVLGVFERIYGIDRKTAAGLTDPNALVTYFSREIEAGMKEMGYAIDWRRKFYSFDGKFNRFIEWQFAKLKQLGLLVQGEHTVPWCPRDNNAVGAHDTKGDVDPEIKEFIWAKFRLKGSDLILVAGTTRPDALLGQTNLWVDPNGKYVIVKVRDEKWVVGNAALEKIQQQLDQHAIIIGEISAKELIGKWVKGPAVKYELYILPAEFIDENVGSGIVYSALEDPVDLYELRKLQTNENIPIKYNLDRTVVKKLKPIPIIDVEGMGSDLGDSIGKEFGITSADQKDKLEEAKGELNRRVFRKGIMNSSCGKYSGMSVPNCQEMIKKELIDSNDVVMFWEIDNKPVYCRCGAEVIANVVKNQWFINYGNEEWKEKARECVNAMSVIPGKNRADYLYVIGWLREKACTRAAGLGTKFPFDKKQMIEALSDSTIYMAFYTISHLLDGVAEHELTEEFFDYVFYGKGKGSVLAKKCRESFLYWYPLDSRHSGADLVRNHLPFFIFNHAAIFPKQLWPKQIVTNGFVMMDGSKMSKSMGNILPLRKAIAEYGADIIRFSVVCGADLSSDTDFNKSVAEGIRSRIAIVTKLIEASIKNKSKHHSHGRAEKWLLSRLNRKIERAEKMYESFQIRELALTIFYDVISDLQWYMKRTQEPNLHDFFVKWVPLIAPFMPHYAEEYWEMLSQKGFVINTTFPKSDKKAISDEIEAGEALVVKVRDDIENLRTLLKIKPKQIWIFVANDLKRKIYSMIAKEKSFDKIMKAASSDPEMKTRMDVVQKMAKSLAKNVHALGPVSSANEELDALTSADAFLETEFQCEVSVRFEDESKHERAKNAMPGKPAIVLE